MESARRHTLVYGLLLAAWALILSWQTAEHFRVERAARAQLVNRAKDISTTLGVVLRSQRRFGGVISKERLESALTDLVGANELTGIALLNAAGDVVAFAGALSRLPTNAADVAAERWDDRSVTLMNLVDLGTNVSGAAEAVRPPIVLPREEIFRGADTNRVRSGSPAFRNPERAGAGTNAAPALAGADPLPPPPEPGSRGGQPRFPRPPWMGEAEYKALLPKQGVHSFVMGLSSRAVRAASAQDLRLRAIIALLATVSAAGLGLAWRNLSRSGDLQLRLVRASELTAHLKEMNLAAAGLAHETRNPLNIIRGLAQMISKQPDAPAEIRDKSRAIVAETDKVTGQLNDFINYSRPRDVRRTALALPAAIHEVLRALSYDIEEKKVSVEVQGEALMVEADDQLLRQTLFNLLFNAVQAVGAGGAVQIASGRRDAGEAWLEVRDDGPGVPPERRQDIFKPYFTTREGGTGLGLAVVKQIALAHGWEIECLPNQPKGAVFRLTHLNLAGKR